MTSATVAMPPANRLRTYASFVRFEHTLFSLPLILAGIFSVPGPALSAARWALIAIAAVGARTAAMALNRLIDRRLDALNPRTQARELPAGTMKLVEAWALLSVSTAAYLGACAALGVWYVEVAPIPLIVFTVYPYLKRWTPLCHLGVGTGLALAPLAGYAAAHPDLQRPSAAIWLASFALFWVSGFDIIYATLDEEFDRAHGVKSIVALLGRVRGLRWSWWFHVVAIVFLGLAMFAMTNSFAGLGHGRFVRAGITTAFSSLAVWLLWREQKWAEDVNLAFFKTNVWVGFVVLAMVLSARMEQGGF